MLQFLEESRSNYADRLVVALIVENEKLLKEKSLKRHWGLGKFKQSLVVELEPLREITRVDVSDWYQLHHIAEKFRLSETELINKIFPDPNRLLRLRTFESEVTPLLERKLS